jgi:glycosyltransferase involved in cell wall biosynthesis
VTTDPRRGEPDHTPSRVRVCLLTDSFYPIVGGGETQARLLSSALKRRGHDVFVLTQRRLPRSPRREEVDGVEVVRVGVPHMDRWGKYLMMPLALVKLLVLARRYDLVYVAGLRTLGLVGVVAARATGRRCVLRSASCTEMSGESIFDFAHGPWRLAMPLLRGYVKARNAILRQADAFLAMSTTIGDEYRGCGVRPDRIARIPNGVELNRFQPVDGVARRALREGLGLPADKMLVTYTGKLTRGKGLETLLRSWRDLARERPDAHLVLVGSGRHMFLSCEAELRAFVTEHRLDSRVTFTGYQTNVEHYLQASDVYVMPSQQEALSNSLIEGLSCGLPAVVSAVGGMLDVVTHERNALVVPPGNPDALAAALRRVLTDEDLRQRLGDGARQRARAFDIHVVAGRFERFFASVVAGQGVPRDL